MPKRRGWFIGEREYPRAGVDIIMLSLSVRLKSYRPAWKQTGRYDFYPNKELRIYLKTL